jgi:DnaK suppressor protein
MRVSKTPAPKPAASKAGARSTRAAGQGDVGVATLDAPAASKSSFTDRFAPPKPPSRAAVHAESHMPPKAAAPAHADPKLANAWKTKPGHLLSDAEVLAMPEGEYMNAKQIEFFRAKLQALKDSVLSNAGETTEHLREDTTIVPDPADRATIEEEHALELRTRDRERKLLKKVVQSLARLDSGDYGYCDETGEPIGVPRLIARPTATLSLEAQQRRELKQKMFGD